MHLPPLLVCFVNNKITKRKYKITSCVSCFLLWSLLYAYIFPCNYCAFIMCNSFWIYNISNITLNTQGNKKPITKLYEVIQITRWLFYFFAVLWCHTNWNIQPHYNNYFDNIYSLNPSGFIYTIWYIHSFVLWMII